ncbi:hypothetical protein [Sphaerisporangium sp. TRM90804]|uniref:hypothetical protein n=1 Tax=Sphaerisporangium sp. TRM90804 TaxID=3031113 RepID=UPI002448D0F6|nr:hypothetical protein [Sphaerisporangium sp. TRM90804]MDH2426688.1 hypothetical protein [Sphaerisporangium sp. TRM90804]
MVGPAEAAGFAAVVVNATPGWASLGVLSGLAGPLSGKVLVDVANATAFDADGFASALLWAPAPSAGISPPRSRCSRRWCSPASSGS